MKTRLRLIVLLLFVLNMVGLIWVVVYSRDDGFRSILLSETESFLQKRMQDDNLEPPSPQTEENKWQSQLEQYKALKRKIESGNMIDEYAMAVRMQSYLVTSYAHSYDRYRTASYFAAVVFGLNMVFLLFAAVVMESLFANASCDEQPDDDTQTDDDTHDLA
ncbi:MAG: hypothetical protein K8R46_12130 [Pirellulales bacterium]|nr:hypothetical protein [Pirellulales bacterium]